MRSLHNTVLAFVCLAAAAVAAQQSGPAAVPAAFVITEPRAVQAAESLYQDVQALAAKVTPCVERGAGSAIACVCSFPAELKRVQERLRTVRSSYPEWEKQVVNWTESRSRQSRAISVEALARQSSPACPAR